MNKARIVLFGSFIILMCSCTTKKQNTLPAITGSKNVINMTINGHTYHDTIINNNTNYIYGILNAYSIPIKGYITPALRIIIQFNTPHLLGVFTANKVNFRDTLGTYRLGDYTDSSVNATTNYGFIQLTDYIDSNRYYDCYSDTTSSTMTLDTYNNYDTAYSGRFNIKVIHKGEISYISGDYHVLK